MKRPPALLVTRLQLKDVLQVNDRTIYKFLDEGMPVARRGKGRQASLYDVGACVRWFIERERAAFSGTADGFSPQKERAILDRKRGEELDLRLKIKRGELVPIEDVAREFADCAAATKARIRRVPDAIVDRLLAVAAHGPHGVKAILLAEIDAALRELATKGAVTDRTAA